MLTTTRTLENRVQELESKLSAVEERLSAREAGDAPQQKRGWRWFVGIYKDSPDFDEVEQVGRQWRDADRADISDDAPETP